MSQNYRAIDGSGNYLSNPNKGAVNDLFTCYVPSDYADGISIPKLDSTFKKPNPRYISNQLFSQSREIYNKLHLSDYTYAFTQFIENDISLVEADETISLNNMVVPKDDKFFKSNQVIEYKRSKIASGSGTSVSNPARYQNKVTGFIDGSTIYGSDEKRAKWLRSSLGGLLKTSEGNLLPWNTVDGNFNSDIDASAPAMVDETNQLLRYFVAGDVRANENPLLIGLHTLFLREHNLIAKKLSGKHPIWDDEKLYQEARRINIAQLQHIAFDEWLPAIGVKLPNALTYRSEVAPEVMQVFAIAGSKMRHTMVNSKLLRLDNDGKSLDVGIMKMNEAMYNPTSIILSNGIESFFIGMGTHEGQELDCKVVDEIRNLEFGSQKKPFDVVAFTINQGRDMGLPDFNSVSNYFGLPSYPSFLALTSNVEEAKQLEAVYGSISNLDPWVGLLAEKHMPYAMMGRLMMTILEKQFQDLRDGDRFYYKFDPAFSDEERKLISGTTIRDIVARNTDISLMQANLFKATPFENIPFGPKPIPVDMKAELYPNPVLDGQVFFNIHSDISQKASIMIYGLDGRLNAQHEVTLTSGINKRAIKIDDLAKGFYTIMLSNGKRFSAHKLIKK
jgi:hypothetical protein